MLTHMWGDCLNAFTILIADLAVRVKPLFGSTREYCREYLTDRAAEYDVIVTREDLVREQELLDLEALEEGLKRRKFAEPFLERAVIQRRIAERLVEDDTLLMHGSTVGVDGYAYLFTAACGTGKSTHTRLWREVFGERAVMVNDDKPFLRLTDEGVFAYGSPWSGKHGLANNVCLPLKGICVLRRGVRNVIRAADAENVIGMLRHQCLIPEGNERITLELVDRLAHRVPLWEMDCTKDPEAAVVAYEAMGGSD